MASYNHANSQRVVYNATYPTSLAPNGDPVKLPENLETLPRAEYFPTQRHRWNTNEEIAAVLINFQKHVEWQSREVKVRPQSGSMLLYSRKKVRYRRDGYCWKKRKDGKTTREDHMKLKVQGVECIYGCYVHSAILPTFHRRCYWLLQNPDVVLVHYLNVPYPDSDAKHNALPPCLALPLDKKEWTRDELASQLRPMFLNTDDDPSHPHNSQHSIHSVDMIVMQLLDRQKSSITSINNSQLAPKSVVSNNQVTSTSGIQQTSSITPTVTRAYAKHTNLTQSQPPTPLVLSLQQIQGSGGLLILNSQPYSHRHIQPRQIQHKEIQSINPQTLVQLSNVECIEQIKKDVNTKDGINHSDSLTSSTCNAAEGTDFSETLDLSQEDIQQTLSANMVSSSPASSPAENQIINAMDFISTSDDVLVNLDAFDVFGDFAEFNECDKTHSKSITKNLGFNSSCPIEKTVRIAEYSPEWSYTEGGVKVLIAGPWTGDDSIQTYSVLFDAEPVEANLVQPGVLRCRCPAHAPGIALLQVACDGFVVSDSVAFEYRQAPTLELNHEKALLARLTDLESRLQGSGSSSPGMQFEERLVTYCQNAAIRPWQVGAEPLQSRGPTLLHLTAGLGFSRLVCALLYWRVENPSSVLEAEVDALKQDAAGLTPLAWACAAGHIDTARILYRWNAMALHVRDCQNRNAVELATENGNSEIVRELNLLEAERRDELFTLLPSFHLDCSLNSTELDLTLWKEDSQVFTYAEQIITTLAERTKKGDNDSQSSITSSSVSSMTSIEDAVMDQTPNNKELFDSYRDCSGGATSVLGIDVEASPSSPSSCCLTPELSHNNQFNKYTSTEKKIATGFKRLGHNEHNDEESETDLSRLTLSDREHHELYHAAKIIQKAYRNYKGRQRQEEAEKHAAILIQQYYRRHKQYTYHRQASKAALVIQNNYRNYRARPTMTNPKRNSLHQQAAHQAAKKIQQFMRQSQVNTAVHQNKS